jgi:hypothetical protein
MANVTAAHRKSVTSKAASAKAVSPPPKTAATTRERRRSTRCHRCRADGKCCRKRDHRLAHVISPSFEAHAGSKDEIAQLPGCERLFYFIVRTRSSISNLWPLLPCQA